MSRLRAAARWVGDHPGYAAAVLAGFLLRLAWVTWITEAPPSPLGDTAQNLSMAEQFSRLQSYRLNGVLTAYHAPGYSLLLAPLLALARLLGGPSPAMVAALVNVAAGTATIVLGAELARRWVGPGARTPAAWLLAVAAGPIYLTAVAYNETVHTAVTLAALLIVTVLLQGPRPASPSTPVLVGLGLLLGTSVLVRATGAVLVVVVVLALRLVVGSWRTAVRPAVVVLVAAAVLVVPWVVRNRVQVGVWAVSTNAAAFLCHGHGDAAQADEEDLSDADIAACFEGTPYGPDPDEARWYRRTVDEAIRWAVDHPGEELSLTWDKTVTLYADDSQALADAVYAGDAPPRLEPATYRRLDALSDLWHRLVLGLALVGLALSAGARRAWPLWLTVAGLTASVWAGSVLDRYHHTIMALLVVAASATMVAVGRWASAGIRDLGDEIEDPEDEAPPPPPEGMARAAVGSGRLAGPTGHPFAPVLLAVATGAWACALVFDAISIVSSTEWVYARGAWLLTGIGVAAGLVGSFAVLADLLAIPRGTVAFRTGVRHLIALDVALVCFTASFLVRNASDFLFHDPSPTAAIALSVLGLAALAVMTWIGGTLTYGYGVRVALDEERRAGFEPAPDA